jgi:MFS family permease
MRHLARVSRQQAPVLMSAGSGQLFAQSIRTGRNIIIPLFAADMLGLGVEQIGWIMAISAGVDSLLFPLAGYIMDRFGRKWAYVPSFLIQGLAMGLIPLSTDFGSLVLATSLLGFGNGLGSGTMMTLGADLAPPDSRGEFLGVWRLIGDGGHVVGPVLIGGMAQGLGLVAATFGLAGVGLLAGLMLGALVPETLQREPHEQPSLSPTK